jgi:hypothetical protein
MAKESIFQWPDFQTSPARPDQNDINYLLSTPAEYVLSFEQNAE